MKANNHSPFIATWASRLISSKLILAVTASLLISPCWAADIYKYRDSNGVWVFTDEKPQTEDYKKNKLLFTKSQEKVSVVNRGTDKLPILYAINQVAGPVEVWLEFTQSENVKFSRNKPFSWVVSGPGEALILELGPEDPSLAWSYGWSYAFVPGAPMSESSLSGSPLGLPVKGGPFVISQAFKGASSHSQHAEAHYAVDIAVPENTPVIAVRSGLVMDAEKDFSRAGWSAEYADEANMVRVLHEDGSMGLYAHLRVDGVEVSAGQKIRRGQLLGYSGNTGFSNGPHLHFVLQINTGKKLVSVPFKFEGYSQEPQKGDTLGPN